MFCPNCGAPEQSPNAYCKRCGEWLLDTKRAHHRRFGVSSPAQNFRKLLVMSGMGAVFSFIASFLLFSFNPDATGHAAAINLARTFCLVTAIWQLATFIIGMKLRKRLARGRTTEEPEATLQEGAHANAPALGAADASQFVRPPSITESTTELLEPLPHRRTETGERR